MFDATQARSRWPMIGAALVVAAVMGGAAWVGLDGLDVLLAGGNPLAAPTADVRHDQPYRDSPLALALELEGSAVPVDREGVLAWADALAEQLGVWLLAETGASDIHEAERRLWRSGKIDLFAARFAVALQDRRVFNRRNARLSEGVDRNPLTVHPDDLALLFAHVAWRLDLDTELVRSPVHLYVIAHDPDGDGTRAIEATCFQRVDALGGQVASEEPSIGRRLVLPPENYLAGAVGIHEPDPLPPGSYEPISEVELPADLAVRLAARHPGSLVEALEAHLGDGSAVAAQALHHLRVAEGIAAWEQGDLAALAEAAAVVRRIEQEHPSAIAVPDGLVLVAADRFARGEDGWDPLSRALPHYSSGPDPVETVRSDAHAMALWLALRHGRGDHEVWNTLIIPLMNRHHDDPARFQELCGFGRRALRTVEQTLEELMPDCGGR